MSARCASQREDGAWGFTPGIVDPVADPAPTALAIDALVSLGASHTDPAAAKGVQALLALQDPYGRWNRAAKTGFVTTSYVLNTLARLYPDKPQLFTRRDFEPQPNESLQDSVARMRRLAQLDAWSVVSTEAPAEHLLDLMQAGPPTAARAYLLGDDQAGRPPRPERCACPCAGAGRSREDGSRGGAVGIGRRFG
jgi:hypothetical protein